MELRLLPRHSANHRRPSLESQRVAPSIENVSRSEKRTKHQWHNPFVRDSWQDTEDFASANPVHNDLARAAKRHRDRPKFLNDYAHISGKPRSGLRAVFDLIVKLPPGTSEEPAPNTGWYLQTALEFEDQMLMGVL